MVYLPKNILPENQESVGIQRNAPYVDPMNLGYRGDFQTRFGK